MNVGTRVADDRQLARLLQIGIVLEEVVEARAYRHYRALAPDERAAMDDEIATLLDHAAEESAEHRERLEALVDELEADSVPFDEIETLVASHYGQPEGFDGILYDQLNGEETAYKFYDDLIAAIEAAEVDYSIDRERVLETLRAIRAEEEEGAQEVADIMEDRA